MKRVESVLFTKWALAPVRQQLMCYGGPVDGEKFTVEEFFDDDRYLCWGSLGEAESNMEKWLACGLYAPAWRSATRGKNGPCLVWCGE